MELINSSRAPALPLLVLDTRGEETLLVVVKASFDITPGKVSLAEEQDGIVLADDYHGEPGQSSIRHAGDGVLFKPSTDVVLIGSAHAPGGRPCTRLDVVLKVGKVAKTVRVFGDRRWERGLVSPRASEPAPFERVPLVYERSFGGTDATVRESERRNPVGVGFRGKKSALPTVGVPLPNLEDPAQLIGQPADRPAPAGFGFIAPHWEPRSKYAGTYDQAWMDDRAPLLPPDYDPRFQQVAPTGQVCAGYLAGGEPVEVRNASPSGLLGFPLPKLQIEVLLGMEEPRALDIKLDTVVIDGDRARLVMTWRGSAPMHGQVYDVEWIKVSAEVAA